MESRIENLFDSALSRWQEPAREQVRGSWTPDVDIYETDTHLVVRADLPGVDPEKVTARVEGGRLLIKGQRERESKVRPGDYQLAERIYGPFSLWLELPATVDPDSASAEYRDGVLTVTLAIPEKARAKKIKIVSETEPAQASAAAAS